MRQNCYAIYSIERSPEKLCGITWHFEMYMERPPFDLLTVGHAQRTVVVRRINALNGLPVRDFPETILFIAGYMGLLDDKDTLIVVIGDPNGNRTATLLNMGAVLLYDTGDQWDVNALPSHYEQLLPPDYFSCGDLKHHSINDESNLRYCGPSTPEIARLAGAVKLDEGWSEAEKEIRRRVYSVMSQWSRESSIDEVPKFSIAEIGTPCINDIDVIEFRKAMDDIHNALEDVGSTGWSISEEILISDSVYETRKALTEKITNVAEVWKKVIGRNPPKDTCRIAYENYITDQKASSPVKYIIEAFGIDYALSAFDSGTPLEYI